VIPGSAHIGAVHLTVSDLGRSARFYRDRLGFALHALEAPRATLGAGGPDLLVVEADAHAPRAERTTGLYHFAILVPSRAELARSLRALAEGRVDLQGAADHGVSESLYLADPDGNGIEIYRDRPREEWPFVAGRLRMVTDPLDLHALASEAAFSDAALAERTTIGHVHLRVADLAASERFYVDVLGFELTQRFGPAALFVAAGGYHHHVGMNTWDSAGAPPPPAGAIGLRHFEVVLPDRAAVEAVTVRARAAGLPVEDVDGAALVRDPSSNGILLAVTKSQPR
jgi:catechol 2,3-dioxygenase